MTPVSVVCRAKDSYAQLASAWRLVQVQQQYAVNLTLPLTLSAANLTDAQAQADVLTATSNATDALESALAAGLISGEPVLDGLCLLLIGCWLVSACLKHDLMDSCTQWQLMCNFMFGTLIATTGCCSGLYSSDSRKACAQGTSGCIMIIKIKIETLSSS